MSEKKNSIYKYLIAAGKQEPKAATPVNILKNVKVSKRNSGSASNETPAKMTKTDVGPQISSSGGDGGGGSGSGSMNNKTQQQHQNQWAIYDVDDDENPANYENILTRRDIRRSFQVLNAAKRHQKLSDSLRIVRIGRDDIMNMTTEQKVKKFMLPEYYMAFSETDAEKLEMLIRKRYTKLAIGFAMLTVKYIGKDSHPPGRVSGHKNQVAASKTKFELWVDAEAAAGRTVKYLYAHVIGRIEFFEIFEAIAIRVVTFLSRTQLLNTQMGNDIFKMIESNYYTDNRLAMLLFLVQNSIQTGKFHPKTKKWKRIIQTIPIKSNQQIKSQPTHKQQEQQKWLVLF